MTTNNDALRDAAQELIDRWEAPLWKDAPATAVYITHANQVLEGGGK